jgi:hypothetical protein
VICALCLLAAQSRRRHRLSRDIGRRRNFFTENVTSRARKRWFRSGSLCLPLRLDLHTSGGGWLVGDLSSINPSNVTKATSINFLWLFHYHLSASLGESCELPSGMQSGQKRSNATAIRKLMEDFMRCMKSVYRFTLALRRVLCQKKPRSRVLASRNIRFPRWS